MKEEMLDFFLSDQISTDIFIFFAEKSVLQAKQFCRTPETPRFLFQLHRLIAAF